jgi:hypothetical protein
MKNVGILPPEAVISVVCAFIAANRPLLISGQLSLGTHAKALVDDAGKFGLAVRACKCAELMRREGIVAAAL